MLDSSGLTDVGKRRDLNEDTILADGNLFVVCDGMGGHKAGEVASQLAVEVIARFVTRSLEDDEITWPYGFLTRSSYDGNRLRTAIKLANRTVNRKAASSDDYTGMGTTVTAALVARNRPSFTYANVGDSRIYLIRNRTIVQLSRDDSWANLPWGPEGPDPSVTVSMQHVLTKALGAQEDVDFEVDTQELSDGDQLLLCSDGLTNMLTDERILELVLARNGDLDGAVRELIDESNAAGGRDNISAVLVRYSA
jgi:protein phosphatase